MSTKHFLFIGFMCAGKTTFATKVAQTFSYRLYEIDSLVEKALGMTIPEIFRTKGEKYFREAESAIFESIINDISVEKSVISAGGGLVLSKRNQLFFNKLNVIFIDTPFEALLDRIVNSSLTRPILSNLTPNEIKKLWEKRRTLYQKFANHTVKSYDELLAIMQEIICKNRES